MTHADLATSYAVGYPRLRVVAGLALRLNILDVRFGALLPGAGAAVCCALALGCVPDGAQLGQGSSTSVSGSSRAVVAPPPLSLTAPQPWPPAFTADPLWRRASEGTDLDRARLAQRESALTLLVAIGQGGSLGLTALRSLAHASDRREARSGLCELLPRADAATRPLLLESIYEALVNGAVTEDSLDRDADARCSQLLDPISQDASHPEERDLALGAIHALAAR